MAKLYLYSPLTRNPFIHYSLRVQAAVTPNFIYYRTDNKQDTISLAFQMFI